MARSTVASRACTRSIHDAGAARVAVRGVAQRDAATMFAWLLFVALALSLAACGGGSQQEQAPAADLALIEKGFSEIEL